MELSLKLSVQACLSYNVLGQLVAMCDKHNGAALKALVQLW